MDAEKFRKIFLSTFEQNEINRDAYDYCMYLPTDTLLQIPLTSNDYDFLESLRKNYSSVAPIDLYNEGCKQKIATKELDKLRINFKEVLLNRTVPLTVFIIPGIFSEFINTVPFSEVFYSSKSSFRDEWKKRTAGLDYSMDENCDWLLSIEEMTMSDDEPAGKRVPLTEIFKVSSLEENGVTIANVVIFNTPFLSMETVGDISIRADNYNRRLGKFLNIMLSKVDDIAFIGYSRGTVIGLDMLASAKQNNEPWLKKVKAMISLGGVTYGTHIADAAFEDKNNPNNKLLSAVTDLSDGLAFAGNRRPGLRFKDIDVFAKNTGLWIDFSLEMARTFKINPMNTAFNIDLLTAPIMNNIVEAIGSFIKTVLKSDLDLHPLLNFGIKGAFSVFNLDNPFTEYDLNIKKFKTLVQEVVVGVRQLSVEERVKWWKERTLPVDGIRYYALAGTMSDDMTIRGNTYAYNKESVDFKILTSGYKDYISEIKSNGNPYVKNVPSLKLNDSQVAVHNVRFWQEYNKHLNEYYNKHPMKASFLGVAGTHHWGLAMKCAIPTKSQFNPFPRVNLLKALVATVLF